MEVIDECTKCGKQLEYWERVKVTRVYVGKKIKEEKDVVRVAKGFQCEECEWSTEGFS